jgi:hypothetical protein
VQVWRLVTNFLFLGKLSLNFVIRMIWVVQYGGQLEGQIYQFEPADFLFMLIFNGGLLLLTSIVMGKDLNGGLRTTHSRQAAVSPEGVHTGTPHGQTPHGQTVAIPNKPC